MIRFHTVISMTPGVKDLPCYLGVSKQICIFDYCLRSNQFDKVIVWCKVQNENHPRRSTRWLLNRNSLSCVHFKPDQTMSYCPPSPELLEATLCRTWKRTPTHSNCWIWIGYNIELTELIYLLLLLATLDVLFVVDRTFLFELVVSFLCVIVPESW